MELAAARKPATPPLLNGSNGAVSVALRDTLDESVAADEECTAAGTSVNGAVSVTSVRTCRTACGLLPTSAMVAVADGEPLS